MKQGVTEQEVSRVRRRLGGSEWVPSGDLSHFRGRDEQADVPAGWAKASAPARSHRKRRRRLWARRHPFLLLFFIGVIAIGAGGLYVASQAASTSTTILRQSTPPASVELQLGEDTDSEIPSGEASVDEGAGGEGAAVYTAPARAAVAEAGKAYEGGPGVMSGVSDVIKGGADATGLIDGDTDPINVLLMGVDARPGESIDVGVRPDSLAVLRLNPETGGCAMLRIPRDTRVNLAGYGMSKVNHALAVGGIPYQALVVANYLGIRVDRYALIDFSGVEALVDAVGGVTVPITDSFSSGEYTFEPGERRLQGEEALAYSRYRGGPDGDFGRIRRQQQIIRGLIAQAGSAAPQDILDVLPLLKEHLRMDLTVADLVTMAEHFRGKCTEETLITLSLQGEVATLDDAVFDMPLSFVVVDDAEVRRKVDELLDV